MSIEYEQFYVMYSIYSYITHCQTATLNRRMTPFTWLTAVYECMHQRRNATVAMKTAHLATKRSRWWETSGSGKQADGPSTAEQNESKNKSGAVVEESHAWRQKQADDEMTHRRASH